MGTRRKIIIFIILIIIILNVTVISLWLGGKKKNISVEGFEIEYNQTSRKMEDIEDIELGSSIQEIINKLGEPDAWTGSGMTRPVYFLENKKVVVFHFNYPAVCEDLKQVVLVSGNGKEQVIKEKYFSFNEVPQSSLMLSGLLDELVECYSENQNDASTESISETETNIEVSEATEISTDAGFSYTLDALSYAGSYVGNNGYSISFSAYSFVEDDEIGVVDIYYNGELVNSNQPIYICTDRGTWSDRDYDQFYVIYVDGHNEYLGFYESEGTLRVDYNGPEQNYDSLEMTEHYEV